MSVSAGKETSSKVKNEVDYESDEDDNVPISNSMRKKEVKKERDFEDRGISNSNKTVRNIKKTKVKTPKKDIKKISAIKKVKEEVKGAARKKTKATVVKKREKNGGAVREKKVYDFPGQKHDPPEERDPLTIFYRTLYEQVPTSDMAAIWLMEWGLLPEDEAAAVFEKKKNQLTKLKSPIKITTVKRTSIHSVKAVNKKIPSKSNSAAKKKNESKAAAAAVTKKTQSKAAAAVKKMIDTKKPNSTDDSSDDDDNFIIHTKKRKFIDAKE